MRRSYFFAGMTKTQLKAEIRAQIGLADFGQEFGSALISDLIEQKHYCCSRKGLRPTRFRKLVRPGAAYDFWGYFEGRGWHKVSWAQCIEPRDELDWLKVALSNAAQPIVARRKLAHPICERCGIVRSEHVDHVDPEFDVIAKEIISEMTTQQIDECFLGFDWWSEEPFMLPAEHPAIRALQAAHLTAKLQAVCQPCHVLNARGRRAA